MFRLRYVWLAPVAASALLLADAQGYLGSPGFVPSLIAPPSRTPPLDPATPPDPDAAAALDEAVAFLGPEKTAWLEMTLWQQVDAQGLSYQAQGRYVSGPDHRLRVELDTYVGATRGQLRIVSDGHVVCHVTRSAEDAPTCSQLRLPEVLAVLNVPGTPRRVSDDFYREQAFGGVVTLLPGLRQRLNWVRKETVRRGGRVFVKLTGTWTPAEAAALCPPGQPWPAGLPRQCKVYLDADTLWPHRVEWWGPDPPRPGEALLAQAEYRDPVLNQPLSPERAAREFTPDVPPEGVTTDVTDEVVGKWRSRAQHARGERVPETPQEGVRSSEMRPRRERNPIPQPPVPLGP
jgi:hypothetical protein